MGLPLACPGCGHVDPLTKAPTPVRLPTVEEVEERLRANARAESRSLDAIDMFLINMTRIMGVEVTDRYITGGTD